MSKETVGVNRCGGLLPNLLADRQVSAFPYIRPKRDNSQQQKKYRLRPILFLKGLDKGYAEKDYKYGAEGEGISLYAFSRTKRYLLVKIRTFFDENPDCEF
ncbi:MAG: hypothetical protein AAB536_02510 [Patescibacteria group bacterium]